MSSNCTNKWHCHICNLDVPISHIQDHNDSWEHEAYASICQESLKRLNNLINPKNCIADSSKDNNTYFCFTCSVIVNNDETNIHLKSKHHNESKIKEKLLKNFLKLYVDGSNFNKTFYDGVRSNIIEMGNLYNLFVTKQDESKVIHNSDRIDEQADRSQNNKVIINDEVEIIKCEVKNHNELLSTIDDAKVTIGNTEQTDDSVKLCNVCLVKIPKRNWSGHEKGKKHKQKLKKKKAGVHYQMQISDNSFVINCRICSTEVSYDTISIETHLKSPEHTTKYENLLKTNNIVKTGNRLACVTCGINMDYKLELCHIDTLKHKRALAYYTIADLEIQESNVIGCKICKKKVSSKPAKMSEHLKSDLHTVGRDILLSQNNIKGFSFLKDKYNLFTCDWCDQEFDRGTLHEHISSASHQIHVQELVDYENKIVKHYMGDAKYQFGNVRVKCVICDDNEYIYKVQRHIYWHTTNCSHEVNHKNLLSKNQIEKVQDHFHCNLCNVKIEAFEDIMHINSLSHKNKLGT